MSRQPAFKLFNRDKVSTDEKYRAYVQFYINLDTLIWRNLAIGLSITAIGAGAIGTVFSRHDFRILPLSHSQTIAVCLLFIGIFYVTIIYVIWRMRKHHELMEEKLRTLEATGYFHDRLKSTRRWWSSAPYVTRCVFGCLAILCFGYAVYLFLFGEEIMQRFPISIEEAKAQFGISTNHERMENGELRFRLMGTDGNGYIRTVAPPGGGWQKSHSHKEFRELYVVERGWMAVATPVATGEPELILYFPGQHCLTKLYEVHNIYLPDSAVIHTIKFGAAAPTTSWIPNDEFTRKTHAITEDQILQAGQKAK